MLEDLRSDFSVFHRVDDFEALPGPRFFSLAWRIGAYDGVVAARRAHRRARAEQAAGAPPMSLGQWAGAHPDAMAAAAADFDRTDRR